MINVSYRRFYRPFDIVKSVYHSTDDRVKVGLFLVVRYDGTTLLGAKLTSQYDARFLSYSIRLFQESNPFLQKDSWIQIDHLFTLPCKCCEFVGSVCRDVRLPIKNTFNAFAMNTLLGFTNNLDFEYISPNVLRKNKI